MIEAKTTANLFIHKQQQQQKKPLSANNVIKSPDFSVKQKPAKVYGTKTTNKQTNNVWHLNKSVKIVYNVKLPVVIHEKREQAKLTFWGVDDFFFI